MGMLMTYLSTNFHITEYHKMESRMKNSLQLSCYITLYKVS